MPHTSIFMLAGMRWNTSWRRSIVRRREEKPQTFGEFRTKEMILKVYDAMAEATRTGGSYQTILDPPPGQGRAILYARI